jgi:hypothetical protein
MQVVTVVASRPGRMETGIGNTREILTLSIVGKGCFPKITQANLTKCFQERERMNMAQFIENVTDKREIPQESDSIDCVAFVLQQHQVAQSNCKIYLLESQTTWVLIPGPGSIA